MSDTVFVVKMMVLAWIYSMIFHRMNSFKEKTAAASLELSACCSSFLFFLSIHWSFIFLMSKRLFWVTSAVCNPFPEALVCQVWYISQCLLLSIDG